MQAKPNHGSHKYTKSNVCTGAGISRPTLNKLLNGEVTNKTNFEKHISKLLAFLSLTPSELMGGIANPFTDSKTLRDALHLDLQQLSQRCGLSIEELQKIEAGEDVPLAELRDVAYCLGTGVTVYWATVIFKLRSAAWITLSKTFQQQSILPVDFGDT